MKRICLFFPTIFFICFLGAQTPITLGNANMPGNGDTLRYTNVELSSVGNYAQTGTNFTWDFSSVAPTTQGLREFKSSLFTPYFLFFASQNEYGELIAATLGAGPLTIQDYYNFYKKQNSPAAFIADGAGITFSSVPVPTYYSDKDELYLFPMTYPKYDSTTFRFSTPNTALIPVRYSKTGYRVTRVDGWGTVITPWGTEQCLRLVTTQYATDTIKMSVGTFTLPPIGFPNSIRSYQWLSLTAKIPMMEVTGALVGNNFTPTQARFRGYPQTVTTGLSANEITEAGSLYPNPVRDVLSLPEGTASMEAELFTAEGKFLHRVVIETAQHAVLKVSDLPAGCYLLRLRSGDKQHSYRFIKEDQ